MRVRLVAVMTVSLLIAAVPALALMALRAYGRSTDAVRATLAGQLPTTLTIGKVASVAMSLYALSESDRYAAVVL